MMRNIRSCILIATAFLALNAPAVAQTAYPTKPIRMVVPFSPGGTSDTPHQPPASTGRTLR